MAIYLLVVVCCILLACAFMASMDFSSIKSPPKFDGLNFPIWKVKMNLFLKSLGVRVARAITKEFIEPLTDERSCPRTPPRIMRPLLGLNMH